MTVAELMRRVAGSDYKFDASDQNMNALAAKLAGETVIYMVIASVGPDGEHGILLAPRFQESSPWSSDEI